MESNPSYQVVFRKSARRDILEIARHFASKCEHEVGIDIIRKIRVEGAQALIFFPYKGRVVPELETITSRYREIRIMSYRLIYEVEAETSTVSILLVVHSRQDLHALLLAYLLGSTNRRQG